MFTSSLGNIKFHTRTLNSYAVARMFPDGRTKVTVIKAFSNPDKRLRIKKITKVPASDEETPTTTENSVKLQNSISRTRRVIYEYAACNPWEYFVTLTLGENHDRSDLDAWKKSFPQWIRNYNRINGTNIKYLLIPELHKDGLNWHMHGLLMNLPEEHLQAFDLFMHLPHSIRKSLQQGRALYSWPKYAEKYGYCSVEPVRDARAVSTYVTKYITKDLARCVSAVGAHLYYASKKLERAQVIRQDFLAVGIDNPDFENDYVMIKWFDDPEEALRFFPPIVRKGGAAGRAMRFRLSVRLARKQNPEPGTLDSRGVPGIHRQAPCPVL